MKEEDKSKNNKGNLCNPQCFMHTLIKAAKLTRREDKGRLLAAGISQWPSQGPMGWTKHLHQPVHWGSRKNNNNKNTTKKQQKKTKQTKGFH